MAEPTGVHDGSLIEAIQGQRSFRGELAAPDPLASGRIHIGARRQALSIRPISAGRSRVFILKARNYDLDQPVDDWIRFQEAVNVEDQAMVESQEPQDLPMDLTAESHIAADAWSIAYRRRWKSLY